MLPPIRHDAKENATLEGQLKATLIVSQVPVAYCHLRFSDHTLADAILYRTIHNAYRLSLLGESQRKLRGNLKKLIMGKPGYNYSNNIQHASAMHVHRGGSFFNDCLFLD